MKVKTLTVGMVGSGGDGVVASGDMVLSAVAAEGLNAMAGKSFGPQIRGGECSMRVRVSAEPVDNTGSGLDYLIVLNWRDYHRFSGELNMAEHGIILCEADPKVALEGVPPGIRAKEVVQVEFQKLAEQSGGKKSKNVLTLGILTAVAGIAKDRLLKSIDKKFAKKGQEVLDMNLKAFNTGYDMAKSVSKETWPVLDYKPGTPKMVTDANFAVAAAAVGAGLQVFSGYPITPSTEVMQWLTIHLPRFGGTVVQAEDEIAAVGIVCGASFAGAKAMTTTSGPGMSLKTELIGMASIAELPMVVVNVQRGGPSTGIPTKGEQSDLFQALYSAHGDAPRPVLAACDVPTAIRCTYEAFNLAETYQTPVVLLTDGFMAQGKQVCELPDLSNKKLYPVTYRKVPTAEELKAGYTRFKLTKDGVSPMSFPGLEGGNYLSSGIEHDEVGRPVSDAGLHHTMNTKRIEKLQPIRGRSDLMLQFGDADAKDAFIAWGGSFGPTREALEILRAQGKKTKLLVPLLISPMPVETYKAFLKGVERLGIVELNYLGQLAQYLRTELDLPKKTFPIHRSGGAVFQPMELVGRIKETVLAN
jgi:2-oxoglutarate/2-oxoacid ferredoxin oxidoreductase subunit alpha